MAAKKSREVTAYIAALPPERKKALTALRTQIHKAIPGLTETMRYNMPTFERNGDMVVALGNQKHHMGLYVCDRVNLADYADALAGANLGKGCIRFTSLDDLPDAAITNVLNAAK